MIASRRRFLAGALALGAGALAPPVVRRVGAQPALRGDVFTLGVASGYPTASGVVLWTRLAPTPLVPDGGMPREGVPVEWEIAADEHLTQIVRSGATVAIPEWAHAVHVEVDGLQPARWYWYRFRAGGQASPIGRTRTAPAATAPVDRLRFAFSSCQHYEQGFFTPYRHMVAEDLDLVVFLGDYIYETSRREAVRRHGAPEPHTLEDYRIRHALYKTDPGLQAAHAAAPWLVTWDDHEVSNDYADDRSAALHPRAWFLERRAAAYRAYYEHMPLPRQMVPFGPHLRLYHRAAFGELVQFHVLDDRQFRSPQPCAPAGRGGSTVVGDECAERLSPQATMLGATQEQWLTSGLEGSRARWNVLAQETLMAQLDLRPGPGLRSWTDGWDGYPVARRRLLETLAQKRIANPVVIGGDVHSFWVTDLKLDFDDIRAPAVATEFVSSSITSAFGRSQLEVQFILPDNPHVRLADGSRRGYVRMEVTRDRLRADLRAVRTVAQPTSDVETLASFVVEDGRPGAVPA